MLLKSRATISLLMLVLVSGLGAASAADAQRAGTPQQTPPATDPAFGSGGVSEEHLEKFANVSLKTREIEDKYKAEVERCKTMDDVERVQKKMEGELIDAIHAEDMSLEEYDQVVMAVGQDPALGARAANMMNQKSRQSRE